MQGGKGAWRVDTGTEIFRKLEDIFQHHGKLSQLLVRASICTDGLDGEQCPACRLRFAPDLMFCSFCGVRVRSSEADRQTYLRIGQVHAAPAASAAEAPPASVARATGPAPAPAPSASAALPHLTSGAMMLTTASALPAQPFLGYPHQAGGWSDSEKKWQPSYGAAAAAESVVQPSAPPMELPPPYFQ